MVQLVGVFGLAYEFCLRDELEEEGSFQRTMFCSFFIISRAGLIFVYLVILIYNKKYHGVLCVSKNSFIASFSTSVCSDPYP